MSMTTWKYIPSAEDPEYEREETYGAVGITPATRGYTFGDSISRINAIHGASSLNNMYGNVFKALNPKITSWTEHAISGGRIYDNMRATGIQTAFAAGDLSIGMLGTNDARVYPPINKNRQALKKYLYSLLAWRAVPEVYKVRATNILTSTINPAITVNAGTIATLAGVSADGFITAIFNSSNGATDNISFSVPKGDTVYVWMWLGVTPNYPNAVQVIVDGQAVTTGGEWDLVEAVSGVFIPTLVRIVGLPNTTHTVTIKATTAAVPWIFQCAACFDSKKVKGSNVIIGTTIPQSDLSVSWDVAQYPVRNGAGTVSSTGTTVTGVASTFTQQVSVGHLIANPTYTQIKLVTAVASDTSLTTDTAFNPVLAASAYNLVPQDVQRIYQRGATDNYWAPMIREVVVNMKIDGLRIFLADLVDGFDVLGYMAPDGIHPNDAGHLFIAGVMNKQFLRG